MKMILANIVDAIIKDVSGGKNVQGSIYDKDYVKGMITSYRARKIEADFSRNRKINPACFQKIHLNYQSQLQVIDACYVVFPLPGMIQLLGGDGIRYAGYINAPVINGCCLPTAWRRIFDRSELATLNSHSYMRLGNRSKYIYFLHDMAEERIEVYNDMQVREGLIEAILADPCEAPEFNVNKDLYPMEMGSISEIREIIYFERNSINRASKPDLELNTPAENLNNPPKVTAPRQPTQ